ncbi:FAD-dependent oxidoreductase [Shewanella dokdonensis]|uniref:FAD-dependent oxidoreductase n=1 Tax=Shewanella dokdonensis TaxID=712036 RepID=A0ABX8DCD4_9GAMM|nr:FAD-dependent oxidoreductase [Shewanella dokdonensis]MCL1074772.1 FAD-dependent oxidoreductase [Shewanella dokdonensis]QVK22243.1 FAD-dependent oxidoreductase [Shewanella dokdonensis]
MTKIVIVGGVAGGASAAARARRMSETAQIIMLERGEFVSFANCGLPYHIGGDITARDALLLQTPESFKKRFDVDVRVFNEVLSVDSAHKKLQVKNLLTGDSYEESYDKLLLSPGAAPVKPPIPGINNPHVFTLRNIADMDTIIAALAAHKPQHATVVGGGFIGLEMVEALHQRGIRISLLELASQVMAPVDAEMANVLHRELLNKGIELRLSTGLSEVNSHSSLPSEPEATDVYDKPSSHHSALALTLSSGQTLITDMVIMAVGVKPEVSLANSAGLVLGERGGIKVDAAMRTSDPDIYAVGDAVETPDFVTGNAALVPLAGPANRQGRIAADNMLGLDKQYRRTQGTAICKLFDLAIASTGLNEKTLLRLQLPYEKVYVHTASHAGYYPGAHPVTLKLLFDPNNGKILGAQAVGMDGIDKRIDVLAVAQRAGMTVRDLQDLELTYAPPFGSARDVVNQAGMVATNVLDGDEQVCHADEVANPSAEQLVLDVRNPPELTNVGAFPQALNIPVDQLRQRLSELPKDKEILVACQVGLRGHVAYRMLRQHGFKVRNLTGGFKTFQMTMAKF